MVTSTQSTVTDGGKPVDQIKVLLADDHLLVRAGIRALIDRLEGVEVVGETDEVFETLRRTEELKPHIVLIDVSIPGANGLEVLGRFGNEFPQVAVIVLAMQQSAEYALKAMGHGAKSCLTKKTRHTELEWAIKAAADGEAYLPPNTTSKTFQPLLNEEPQKRGMGGELTARQSEVLSMIAEGYSTKGIATALNISVKTVESHRVQIMERLNIHDIAGLVRYALRHGLVKLD